MGPFREGKGGGEQTGGKGGAAVYYGVTGPARTHAAVAAGAVHWPRMTTNFDPDRLEALLGALPPRHRVAFCASVCERLLPHYALFARRAGWGDPGLLREALDEAWRFAAGETVAAERLRELERRCDAAVPDTEEHADELVSAALDASAAVCETLACCLDGDARRCAYVATSARDTVDMYVQARDAMEYGAPGFEEHVRRDPLMVREMEKQAADLALLRGVAAVDAGVVEKLRGEARSSLGLG
jgi:uncharacterized protein YjaG (DUF416 family)